MLRRIRNALASFRSKERSFEFNAGGATHTATIREAPKPKAPPVFLPLDAEKQEQLSIRESKAIALVAKYVAAPVVSPIWPRELDLAFSAWMSADPSEREAQGEIVALLGSAFGGYLVSRHSFQWGAYTDEYGTDLALSHRDVQLTLFPFDAVSKRIARGEPSFFEAFAVQIEAQLSKPEWLASQSDVK